MGIRSDKPLYQIISEKLSEADRPLTCSTLMDDLDIRREAVQEFGGDTGDVQLATNKLSDTLGFMWRKGVLTRYPAPRDSTSFARWAYALTEEVVDESKPVPSPVKLKSKLLVGVTEHDDCVEIEFDKFIIYVKPKK